MSTTNATIGKSNIANGTVGSRRPVVSPMVVARWRMAHATSATTHMTRPIGCTPRVRPMAMPRPPMASRLPVCSARSSKTKVKAMTRMALAP